jgi:hypothetical protein
MIEKEKNKNFSKTQPWGNLTGQPQSMGTMFGETQTRGNLTGQPQSIGTMFGKTLPSETMLGKYDTIEEELKFNLDKYTDYDEEYPEPPNYVPIEGSEVKILKNDPTLQRIVNSLLEKPKKISDRYVLNISKKFNGYHTYIYDTRTGFSFWSTYYPPDGFHIAKITQQFDEKDRQGPLIPKLIEWKQLNLDDGAFGIRNHKKKTKLRKKKSKRRGKKSKKKTKKRLVGKKRVVGKKSNKKGNVSGKKRRGVKRARTRRRSRA